MADPPPLPREPPPPYERLPHAKPPFWCNTLRGPVCNEHCKGVLFAVKAGHPRASALTEDWGVNATPVSVELPVDPGLPPVNKYYRHYITSGGKILAFEASDARPFGNGFITMAVDAAVTRELDRIDANSGLDNMKPMVHHGRIAVRVFPGAAAPPQRSKVWVLCSVMFAARRKDDDRCMFRLDLHAHCPQ